MDLLRLEELHNNSVMLQHNALFLVQPCQLDNKKKLVFLVYLPARLLIKYQQLL
jgi:hypothetical protein